MTVMVAPGLGWPEPDPDPEVIPEPDTRYWNRRLALPHAPVMEDPNLPHQITMEPWPDLHDRVVMLGCNCGAKIGTRSCWAASEAMAAWRGWHEREGISTDG